MLVHAQPGTIATIAGNGEPAYAGDGGQAVSASLNEPKHLALDGSGHLYIADSENHVIRKLDLHTGLITTIAGCAGDAAPPEDREQMASVASSATADEDPFGEPTDKTEEKFAQLADISGTVRFVAGTSPTVGRCCGDGGPATRATLNFPSAVAVDQTGNLYIADMMNHRIRKVDAMTGIITTLAGTGQHRCSGDGGPAVSATLNEPAAVVVDDKGHLYIADQSNNRVRMVDLDTGVITTVAGSGQAGYTGDGMPASQAGLSGPSGLALGVDGVLYIADTFNGRIRMIDLTTGLIEAVAGDGRDYRYQSLDDEESTTMSRPYGIAADREGNLLITDTDSHLIRRWEKRKKIIARLAGNGLAQFSGDGGPAQASSLNYPFGVAVDSQGNVYIADTFNHRVRKITA